MTIYAFEAQETWLPTVTGLTCNAVEVDEETLRLHFGSTRIAADGITDAERTIAMHGVWRVERGEEIVAGSGDLDGRAAQSRLSFLSGSTLERFEVSQPGFDLDLYFSGDVTVRCFPCDSQEYAEDEDIEEDDDVLVSWWVDGEGVSDDWEEPYDPQSV